MKTTKSFCLLFLFLTQAHFSYALEWKELHEKSYTTPLAQIYRDRGDREKYNEYLNKALKLDPKNELAIDIRDGTCKFICLEELEPK